MWLANFEDGTSRSSKNCYWTDLPQDKRLTGLQLFHPRIPKFFLCLTDMDRYYFACEAMALPFQKEGAVVAEVIGGHDLKLRVGIEVRLETSGNVSIKHYPVERFKYSKDILRAGKLWDEKKRALLVEEPVSDIEKSINTLTTSDPANPAPNPFVEGAGQ